MRFKFTWSAGVFLAIATLAQTAFANTIFDFVSTTDSTRTFGSIELGVDVGDTWDQFDIVDFSLTVDGTLYTPPIDLFGVVGTPVIQADAPMAASTPFSLTPSASSPLSIVLSTTEIATTSFFCLGTPSGCSSPFGVFYDNIVWSRRADIGPGVPEPTAALLFGMGALLVGRSVRRSGAVRWSPAATS